MIVFKLSSLSVVVAVDDVDVVVVVVVAFVVLVVVVVVVVVELPYLLVREIGKFGWFADNNVMKGFCCVIGGYQQARLALTFGQPKRERERERLG